MGHQHLQPLPIKLYRAGDLLTVAALMPGLGPDDITAEVTGDGRLVVQGQVAELPDAGELKSPSKEVLLDEWTPGPYYREVVLPQAVDGQTANVTYGNGVLVVALPLAAQTRPASLVLTPLSPTRGARVSLPGHTVNPPPAAR